MDRISSCATSNSSDTRTLLSVPSGVANLLAMGKTNKTHNATAAANERRETKEKGVDGNLYCFFSISKLQRSLTTLGVTMISTSADKQGRTSSSSSQFILSGFDVVWR